MALFTTTDTLLHRLASILEEFAQQYPEISLQIVVENRSLNLTRRDADVALRPTNRPPQHWIGRTLASVAHGLYAHRDYWAKNRQRAYSEQRWLGVDESLIHSSMGKLIAEKTAGGPVAVTANSVLGLYELTLAGVGIAALPCFLVEPESPLIRIEKPDQKYNVDLWLLSHPDIRRSARVHAFFGFLVDAIDRRQVLFSG